MANTASADARAVHQAPMETTGTLFDGPGEMRAQCRAFEWASTPLGPVMGWSHSLRTTVGLMLASRQPMFLFWGPELVQIFNDAYRPSLGAGGRADHALGARGREFWTDIWTTIGPEIEQIMKTGVSTWQEDQYLPIERNGNLEDVWWTYSRSPVRDDDGRITGTLVTCQETTARVLAERAVAAATAQLREQATALQSQSEALAQSEAKYRALFDAVDAGVAVVEMVQDADDRDVDYRIHDVNPAFVAQTGLVDAVGRTARELVPDLEMHWIDRYSRVARTGEATRFESPIDVMGRWFSVNAFRTGAPADRRVAIFFHDVTAAKTAEQERERLLAALAVEQARLEAVFAQAPSFLAVHRGSDNVFELVNSAYEQIIGHGRDVIGKPLFEAVPESRGQGFNELLTKVRATGEPMVFRELPVMLERERGAALEERFVDVTYLPLVEADGSHDAVIAHGTDVTEQVRTRRTVERLLAESEEAARQLAASEAATRRALDELEATYQTAPVGLGVIDRDLRFQRINTRLAEINGLSMDAHLGRTVREVLPAFADAVEPRLRRALQTGVPEFNVPVSGGTLAAPGVVRHWIAQWLPLRDGSDEVVGINLVAEEVTDRHEADRERERLLAAAVTARAEADVERRRLLAVIEQLPVGIHVAEAPSGRLLLENPAVRAIFGAAPRSASVAEYSADYAGHYPSGHSRDGERLASEDWPMAHTLRTGSRTDAELVEVRRADGTRRLINVSAAPVRDAEGCLVGAVATSVDVTEHEALLAEAHASRTAAESANRSKSEFLAVMSHELRTPLNAIDGYAELIELGIRGPVTAEQHQDLARIRKSQKHLLGLINGVLNYARVEAGVVHYELEDVSVGEVLAVCEALTLPQMRTKGLTLHRKPSHPSLVVRADREKLQQIVLNLLSNAIKFTNADGQVTLSCAREETSIGPTISLRVSDTGIGIAPNQLTRIFEPFVQVDTELTRTRDGTGLGLAISRDLARGMGGELTAQSILGTGTTLTLTMRAV